MMDEKQTTGLFLVGNLVAPDRTYPQAYCRVIKAVVMSAQAPQTSRLVSYQIGVWDHIPAPTDTPVLFVSEKAQSTFCFKTTLDTVLDISSVQTMAVNHFLGLVLMNKPIRELSDAQLNLFSINKAPWTSMNADGSLAFSVYDVQHQDQYRAIDGEDLAQLYGVTTYQAIIHTASNVTDVAWGMVDWDALPRLEFSSEFSDPTSMVTAAQTNLQLPDVLAAFIQTAREQLAQKQVTR